MNIKRFNPPGSPPPRQYHHVVIAQGGTTVYIAGQVAYDEHRHLVGENDVIAQLTQVLHNLDRALQAAGASRTSVVKIGTSVVGYQPEQGDGILNAIGEFFPEAHRPVNTLLGVERLAANELLIEIDAIAVLEAPSAPQTQP